MAKPGKEAEIWLTATQVSKDVVTLFREGDLVDSVSDVASFQQVAGVFTGLSAIRKPFNVVEQPVNHIRTWEQRWCFSVVSLKICILSTCAKGFLSFVQADEITNKFS